MIVDLFSLLSNGLVAGAIYSVVAFGFNVIYRTVKFFHLAHGVVYTSGAYGAYSLTIVLGWDPIPSFFLPLRPPEWSAS